MHAYFIAQGAQLRMVVGVIFHVFFSSFFFVFAIFDQVHAVEAIHGLC